MNQLVNQCNDDVSSRPAKAATMKSVLTGDEMTGCDVGCWLAVDIEDTRPTGRHTRHRNHWNTQRGHMVNWSAHEAQKPLKHATHGQRSPPVCIQCTREAIILCVALNGRLKSYYVLTTTHDAHTTTSLVICQSTTTAPCVILSTVSTSHTNKWHINELNATQHQHHSVTHNDTSPRE